MPVPGRVEPPGASVPVSNLIAQFEEGVRTEEQLDVYGFAASRINRVALVLEGRIMGLTLL
jgi:hypothetical protein